MFYEKELAFLIKTLQNCHLQTTVTNAYTIIDDHVDMGLRKLLGIHNTDTTFFHIFPKVKPYTLYRVSGDFFCKYIFFKIPLFFITIVYSCDNNLFCFFKKTGAIVTFAVLVIVIMTVCTFGDCRYC